MRIVHLVIGGDVAGGQLVALRLLRAARERGDEVAVVSPSEGAFTDLLRAEGVRVHIADVNRSFRLGELARLVGILREERADILHSHTAVAANVLARVAGRLAGVAVVSHLHIENHFRPQRLAAALLRTLDNVTVRLAARVIAVSEGTRTALLAQGYPPGLIEVIPNGVDDIPDAAERRPGLRAELGIPDGVPLVGEVARLCAVKGQRELIDAVATLPGVWLLLVGADLEQGGAYERELREAAEAAGLADRVIFAGYRGDAGDCIAELDVFALPSWIEGMPLVALEAMQRGKPVVATPVGGTAEVVADGETGVIVPVRDPVRLAAALRELLADPEHARRLGEAGRRRARERFSAAASVQRTLEVYDELAR
jgi:glycosyltransferase involved in cell wall biosynthesis